MSSLAGVSSLVWAMGSDFPSGLSLTGWWRAAYGGSPWVGTGSAGTSGSNNASQATNAPDVGAALNGFNTADFELANTDSLDLAGSGSTYFSASAGSAWALLNAESVRADQTNAYEESAILMTSGQNLVLAISASGVRAGLFSSGWKFTAKQALATSTWGLAQMRWNGTNLESRVNGGTWQTVACGNADLTGTLRMAFNSVVGGTAFYDGLMADVGCASTRFDDATFDQILAYCRARYGLSL